MVRFVVAVTTGAANGVAKEVAGGTDGERVCRSARIASRTVGEPAGVASGAVDRLARVVSRVNGLEQGFVVVKIRLSIVLALMRTVLYAVFERTGDDEVGSGSAEEETGSAVLKFVNSAVNVCSNLIGCFEIAPLLLFK